MLEVTAKRSGESESDRLGDEACCADGFVPVRMREGASERPPRVDICRRKVAEAAAEAREPVITLDAHYIGASRVVRALRIGRDKEPRPAERLGISGSHDGARISEVTVDDGDRGRLEPEVLQPLNRSCIPAAGVDHEVGLQLSASLDDEPGHPSVISERLPELFADSPELNVTIANRMATGDFVVDEEHR